MLPEGMLLDIMLELGMHNVQERGEWTNASCPLAPYSPAHKSDTDRHPSFGIIQDEDTGDVRCNCYTCGYNGTLENLISRLRVYHRKNYDQLLLKVILNKHSKGLPQWDRKPAKREEIAKPLGVTPDVYADVFTVPDAIAYMKGRRIRKSAVVKAQLRWKPEEKRIVFPVYDFDKKLYGFTSRTISSPEELDSLDYPKVRDFFGLKKKQFILGSEHFVHGKPVLIVEGLFGYLYLVSIGAEKYFNIGATMGANLSEKQAEKLIKFGEAVYLFFDNDNAGQLAIYGSDEHKNYAIPKLYRQVPLFLPKWPEGKDDPDQLTIEEVETMFHSTSPYVEAVKRVRPKFKK